MSIYVAETIVTTVHRKVKTTILQTYVIALQNLRVRIVLQVYSGNVLMN